MMEEDLRTIHQMLVKFFKPTILLCLLLGILHEQYVYNRTVTVFILFLEILKFAHGPDIKK